MNIPLRDYTKLLQQYLAPQRGAVLVMAALLVASIGLQLGGPQVVRLFIDAARQGAAQAALLWLAVTFLAMTLAQQTFGVLANYWSERVAWTATNALRADLAGHLLHLDLGFHQRHTPGALIERVDGDVNALAGFFSSFAVQLLGSILLLLGILVAVYLVDVRLGWAFSGFVVLTLALLTWVWRRGAPYWRADREQSANFCGFLGEVLTATEDIRSSGSVGYVLRRFFAHLRAWLPVAQRAGLWSQAVMMAAIVAFAVGEAIAYGLGGSLYRTGAVSLGDVYMLLAYMAMLAAPIETIRTQLQDLQHAEAGISRIQELLAVRSRLADGTASLPHPEGARALAVAFCGVRFRYETDPYFVDGHVKQAVLAHPGASQTNGAHAQPVLHSPNGSLSLANWTLDNITFDLPPGHVLGVLGRTGSGKSTLARLIFRMVDPQQGEVRLGGMDLRRARLADVRGRVGLVTQEVQLFAASLRENLTFFDAAVDDETLLAVLNQLGLQPWVARLPQGLDTPIAPTTLSAGEAQLVALARVFLKDPGLVILDEASSRLDPATEILLDQALDRLLVGRTAIIIAHRLATVERADEILILEQGRVLEYGPRLQLAEDQTSRYSELRRIGLQEVLV